MSARILPLLFVSTLALGAGVAPPAQSGGGSSYTPTATDHAGQAMTAQSITLLDTAAPVVVPETGKICTNGPACTRSISYTNSTTTVVGGLTAAGINSTGSLSTTSYVSIAITSALPTCSSGTSRRLYVTTGSPEKLCWCTDLGSGAYQWVNLLDPSDLSGSASACPAR